MSSFFSVSASDVAILAFKPSANGNPGHFTLHLQEIAGSAANFALQSSFRISAVAETAMTEDVILHPGLNESDINLGADETLTLWLTILHSKNDWHSEASQ
jgi:hypothetical protein